MAKAYITIRSNIILSDQLNGSQFGTVGANFQNANVQQHTIGPDETLTLTPPAAWKSAFISSGDGVFTIKNGAGSDLFIGSMFLIFSTETQSANEIEVSSVAGCNLSVTWDLA